MNKKKKNNLSTNFIIPQFLTWLKQQIVSKDGKLTLNAKNFIIYNHEVNPVYVYILPEVFAMYSTHSGITPNLIQSRLKEKLGINFSYTIYRNEEITEVYPCEKFF